MQVGNALGRRELLDDLVKNRFVALLASLGVLAHGYVVWAVVAGHSTRELSLSGLETADPLLVGSGILAAVVLLAGPAYRLVRERRGRDTSVPE